MPEPNEGGQGADPTQAFQKRLDKLNGDAMAFATQLFDENWQLREKNRQLEGKAPSEGAVVLSKADAERWERYRSLGKPEEFESLKEEKGTLAEENAKLKREKSLRALSVAGWDADALADFDDLEGKDIEAYTVKDERDKDGREAKVAYVTVGGKQRPLSEYAKEKRPKLVPALMGQAKEGGDAPEFASQGTGSRVEDDPFRRTREREIQILKSEQQPGGGSIADRFYGRDQKAS